MLKKIITWAIVIFLAFYLLTQPQVPRMPSIGLLASSRTPAIPWPRS